MSDTGELVLTIQRAAAVRIAMTLGMAMGYALVAGDTDLAHRVEELTLAWIDSVTDAVERNAVRARAEQPAVEVI